MCKRQFLMCKCQFLMCKHGTTTSCTLFFGAVTHPSPTRMQAQHCTHHAPPMHQHDAMSACTHHAPATHQHAPHQHTSPATMPPTHIPCHHALTHIPCHHAPTHTSMLCHVMPCRACCPAPRQQPLQPQPAAAPWAPVVVAQVASGAAARR